MNQIVLIINFYTNNLLQCNKIEKFLIHKTRLKKNHFLYPKTVLLVCSVLISVCIMLDSRQYFLKHKDNIIYIFKKYLLLGFGFEERHTLYDRKKYFSKLIIAIIDTI